jgi:hypothetical protein
VPAVLRQRGRGARGQRVGPGLRLGERVGANQLAAGQAREITGFERFAAEVDERQRADRGVRAERSAKRRVDGNLLADIRRADEIEAEAAVRLRNFEAQQIRDRSPSSTADG